MNSFKRNNSEKPNHSYTLNNSFKIQDITEYRDNQQSVKKAQGKEISLINSTLNNTNTSPRRIFAEDDLQKIDMYEVSNNGDLDDIINNSTTLDFEKIGSNQLPIDLPSEGGEWNILKEKITGFSNKRLATLQSINKLNYILIIGFLILSLTILIFAENLLKIISIIPLAPSLLKLSGLSGLFFYFKSLIIKKKSH